MTWRTVTPDKSGLDEIETASHTGVLTEVFRTRYASAPQHPPDPFGGGLGPGRRHAAVAPPGRRHAGIRKQPLRPDARLRDVHLDDRRRPGSPSPPSISPRRRSPRTSMCGPPETSVIYVLPRPVWHRAQGAGAAALAPRPRLSPVRSAAGGARPARGRRDRRLPISIVAMCDLLRDVFAALIANRVRHAARRRSGQRARPEPWPVPANGASRPGTSGRTTGGIGRSRRAR